MQKGKHQGGQTQGYPSRNFSPYPTNPENSRQYSRGEVPAFHASGTPGGGPGMRGMHHAPPTQPPTPPTTQDIKQPQTHLPPQQHQMPPQSGGQMMQYAMTGAGRGSNQQAQYFPAPRAPPGGQRMPHQRTPTVVMSNSQSPYMTQPVVQSVFPGQLMSTPMSGQQPVFVTQHMNSQYQVQQPRHQGGAFYPQQHIVLPPNAVHPYLQPYPQPMYFAQPIPQMPRPGGGGPVQSSQGAAPPQSQTGSMTVVAGPGGAMVPAPAAPQPPKQQRRKCVLSIIDPTSGRDVLQDMAVQENSTPPRSGESSARQTPQPNSGQTSDQAVVAEFATRVAIAARSDQSGSPNSPALQQPSSRTSNYSESESQASPDPQGMFSPSVSPSKLDTSVDSMSSESQIVENNIAYDASQPAAVMRGWPPVIAPAGIPVEHHLMPLTHLHPMVIPDDLIRAGPPAGQPPREYQPVPWADPVPVIIKETPAPMETPVRPGPERGGTPVVSALQGSTVDLPPRHNVREPFPALVKGHSQQSPVKRKQRLEQTQEQVESKAKDQQQQQQQQAKANTQTKPKPITPTVESKKQSTPPSQDSDEYVQSIQTRNSEPKTIITRKNDSDSSDAKVKTNDSLINKENNNLETRNLNEEIIQENNNRNKSEVKCEVPVAKDSTSSIPQMVPSAERVADEEPEDVSASSPTAQEAVPATEDGSKTNGEAITDDAKSNNQKSKGGNKRQTQPKVRPEKKETETPPNEITTTAAAPLPETKPAPPVVINSEQQPEETQDEAVTEEDKEKEKEDLMVAAKNEENNKQTASMKTNDSSHAQVIENVNKVVLRHTYKEDQWSPINPDGKKKYDRDFIMELMHDPQSKKRPCNLPDLELLKDNKQRPPDRNFISSMSRTHGDSLMPNFANKNSSQRGGPAITKRGSQQGKPKPAKTPVIHMSLSLHQDVKLHETENAWKPARVTDHNNMTEEEAKTDSLYKRVRGVLNKLTPQKFNKLVGQVKELPIDNCARLQGVIDLVFQKAVDEPSFSVAYAQMCKTLQKMQVPSGQTNPDGSPMEVNFRKLLINRCQQEFEKNTAAELKREERLKEIEEETDPEKKKLLQIQFEDEERRIRMKSVGNIRFIGELYKLQMLTCKIMHRCIQHLLNEGDEESLECLCKLLTTVGQGLEARANPGDKDNSKDADGVQDLTAYFKKLLEIVKNKGSGKVSSRVRFMIQDLIDLRSNKWVPRRDDTNPKTIDQIQKEAERETMEMNLALNSPQERNKRQDSRNSLDNRKRGVPDGSGWQTVSTPSNRTKFAVESSKLKLNQSEVDVAASLSLGNRTQFMWGQPAGNAKADDKRPQLGQNMFAALDHEKVSQPSSRSSSYKGPSLNEKDNSRMISSYKPGVEDDGRSSRSGSQQGPGSRSSSRDSASSGRRDDRRFANPPNKVQPPPATSAPAQPASNPPAKPLDSEQLMKKARNLLDEYLNIRDLNEATLSLTETFTTPELKREFIVIASGEAMDKKGSAPKRAVGQLMNHFIKNDDISKQQYIEGLSGVLETVEDLAIDLPKVWEYLAELLMDMCADGILTFRDIADSLEPMRGSSSSGIAKFLACLLTLLIKEKGESWVEQHWIISNVSLDEIIAPEDVENFVKQNNVQFLINNKSGDRLTTDTIRRELFRLLKDRASFDELVAWIDKNVDKAKSSKPEFARALMTAMLEATIGKNQRLDFDLFSNYDQLIKRYIDHKEELELPCLFAVQAFVHKLEHPAGLIHSIFEYFWDNELIASESFKLWMESKNPQEQEGHGVASKSLTSFFTVLNENDTDDES